MASDEVDDMVEGALEEVDGMVKVALEEATATEPAPEAETAAAIATAAAHIAVSTRRANAEPRMVRSAARARLHAHLRAPLLAKNAPSLPPPPERRASRRGPWQRAGPGHVDACSLSRG
jgi:hypothetical protein